MWCSWISCGGYVITHTCVFCLSFLIVLLWSTFILKVVGGSVSDHFKDSTNLLAISLLLVAIFSFNTSSSDP